ncbi:putative ADP-ribosylarginine hydrolase Tri1 [Rhodovastum atsumiense]|uniref:ADP-ribosylglycohydrolase family protein n=1 Tax=Rhodovastum atsumiense TaxID=504468 RepID=A0A5M6IV03_9PROT|nr:ADP-ribosylglycohydrolase family protein [Rhodovastum atsumiense]KAA5612133.1 hypothetical protein F1189_10725 [Rhodovastum atsumiense]CAH2603924.1 putative ADP-ribosylarginine hydrolase Tri1 [Rhodovastum atsumiense]
MAASIAICARRPLPARPAGDAPACTTMPDHGAHDRILGAIIGLVVGDAVGTSLERHPRPAAPVLSDMIGGGPFGLPPGGWTDDTSMALGLLDSIALHGRLHDGDIVGRWLAWADTGAYSHTHTCFAIGTQTRRALTYWRGYLQRRRRPAEKLPTRAPELRHAQASGNGGIMRLAPVLCLAGSEDEAIALGLRQCRLTHGDRHALAAARLLSRHLFRESRGHARTYNSPRPAPREQGALDTLLAACWAVDATSHFRDAVLAAANLGEQAGTLAAVTGQIAGARYGLSGIPGEWRARICWSDRIHRLAVRAVMATCRPGACPSFVVPSPVPGPRRIIAAPR